MGRGLALPIFSDFQVYVTYQCLQVQFFDSYALLLLLWIIHRCQLYEKKRQSHLEYCSCLSSTAFISSNLFVR